ncbi:MAG: PIN domain-containing protein [Burkholderiaceae bacterium]|nr:PIN domain-containing protein [Burkholderiaceae bacterium]
MRLFLDANVLFSAAHRETGSVRAFFVLANAGICELVSSAYAVEEARRNLVRKYPQRRADLQALTATLAICGEASRETLAWAGQHGLPQKDVPILAAAAQARVHILVTGDRTDFGHLYRKTLRGVGILPPATALEAVLAAQEKGRR